MEEVAPIKTIEEAKVFWNVPLEMKIIPAVITAVCYQWKNLTKGMNDGISE